MISLSVIDTDAFLEMPATSQNLYFHLSTRGDDDWFVASPNKIMKMCNAGRNDYDVLILKQFIIPFESGICVIRHWKIHNYIRSDRHTPTLYQEEMSQLASQDDVYQVSATPSTKCLPDVSIGKDRIGKDRIESKATPPTKNPTLIQVQEYITARGSLIDPEAFFAHYQANWWVQSNWQKIKDRTACVTTWEKKSKQWEWQRLTHAELLKIWSAPDLEPYRKKYWNDVVKKAIETYNQEYSFNL